MASSTAFPPQTFAKLTPHPFLLANLTQSTTPKGTRTNNRAPDEPRTLQINTSSLSHAHGSAMVRIGDTSVICGVRGELLPTSHIPQWRRPTSQQDKDEGAREMRDYDLLVPNIELATGCAPQFLPGAPPSALAQTLSTRAYSLLHGARLVDAEELRVWWTPPKMEADHDEGDKHENSSDESDPEPELKAYWTLYIDVLFLSFDGNPFDAAWIAILAALRDTKLPRASWDADREMVVCSRQESRKLRVHGLPVACTAVVLTEKDKEGVAAPSQMGKWWLLVDPDREEEKLCEESVSVVVDRSSGQTRIQAMEKVGGRVLGPREMKEIVGVAEQRWDDFSKQLLK